MPAVKERVEQELHRHMKREVLRKSPILGEVPRIRQHEGREWSYGEQKTEGYKKIEAEMTLSREEIRQGDIQLVFEKYSEAAEVFAETQTRDMFDKVSEAAESVGNVVKANGTFSQEAFLEIMETVETDFDPVTGEPKGVIVMHPDLLEKVLPEMRRWEQDEDFQTKLEEIRQQQRMKWRDRKSRRRLVD